MQAIETIHNGYRFRSRLEARWAVFFDALGIRYEYEKEGFEFEGYSYLPDFYLPDYGYFVEIKPPELTDVEYEKLRSFAANKKLLLIAGTPGEDDYTVEIPSDDELMNGLTYSFCKGRKCDRLWLAGDSGCFAINCDDCPEPKCGDKQTSEHFGIGFAYEAARQARFEHGERQQL